jgi:hypothetical protein
VSSASRLRQPLTPKAFGGEQRSGLLLEKEEFQTACLRVFSVEKRPRTGCRNLHRSSAQADERCRLVLIGRDKCNGPKASRE